MKIIQISVGSVLASMDRDMEIVLVLTYRICTSLSPNIAYGGDLNDEVD